MLGAAKDTEPQPILQPIKISLQMFCTSSSNALQLTDDSKSVSFCADSKREDLGRVNPWHGLHSMSVLIEEIPIVV